MAPRELKEKNGANPMQSPLLSSPLWMPPLCSVLFLFLPRSIVLALNSVCCCQSEEQAVKMWPPLVYVCVHVCASVFLSMHVRLPLL